MCAAFIALTLVGCNKKQDQHGHEHTDQTHQHHDVVSSQEQDSNATEQVEFDASKNAAQDTIVPAHDHSSSGHQH